MVASFAITFKSGPDEVFYHSKNLQNKTKQNKTRGQLQSEFGKDNKIIIILVGKIPQQILIHGTTICWEWKLSHLKECDQM